LSQFNEYGLNAFHDLLLEILFLFSVVLGNIWGPLGFHKESLYTSCVDAFLEALYISFYP
jgi:hypothetical protein